MPDEYDALLQNDEPIRSEAERLGLTREQAIELGRRYGEDEANRRGETGDWRESRIKRAMAYAAWEFDGKPSGGAHLREFGVETILTPSLERAIFGRLLKKGNT